ncbi:RuvB helicase [Fasciola hepatica]|nr:RuvB helicase [Fasciola hepatica]
MIIRTLPYSSDDVIQILHIRAQTEGIKVSEQAFARLAAVATDTTLRYAVQLLTPASRIAQLAGRDEIEPSDVEEVCSLFLNAKQSAKILAEHESQFMK